MKKLILIFLFSLLCEKAEAQQSVELCTPVTSGGVTTCAPVSSANPFPMTVGTSSITGILPVANGGTGQTSVFNPAANNLCPILAYGDSLTAGTGVMNGGWPTVLVNDTNCNVMNLGIGGQTSTQIAQRQGSESFTITLTSNTLSAGSNTVTSISATPLNGSGAGPYVMSGTLCAYHGNLSATSGSYTFTPDSSGGLPTACAASSAFSADTFYNYPQIIFSGRNNLSFPSTVESDVATMVAALTTPNYTVLSVLNAENEPSGSANYNNVIAINTSFSSSYGAKYLNVRSFLVSNYSPSNPVDVIDHGNDVPPYTLHALYSGTVSGNVTTATCSSSNITLVPASTAPSVGGVIAIGSEYILMNTLSGNVVTSCTRGYAGTTIASYTGGTAATWDDPLHLNQSGYNLIAQYVYQNSPFLGESFSASANNRSLYSFSPAQDTLSASIAIGASSLSNATMPKASYASIAIGDSVMPFISSANAIDNVGIGNAVLFQNTSGAFNVGVGYDALHAATAASDNVAVGYEAGLNATSSDNIFLGYLAGSGAISGGNNIAIGSFTLTTSNSSGSNIGIGYGSLAPTTGGFNVALGHNAGNAVTSGAHNTIIGYQVGHTTLTTGINNILIGTNSGVDAQASSSSNTINIGNLIYATGIGTSGTNPTGSLAIGTTVMSGQFTLGNASSHAGQATCWTTSGQIGYCTTIVGAGGGCTCTGL